MSEPLVDFDAVAWGPPGHAETVFSGLSLRLRPGELTVLTSVIGGGKSSALRLAVGLEQPTSGTIRICGLPPAEARTRIGYVAGQGALLANLALRDNLVLPLRWLRDPPPDEVESRAKAALALFGITALPAIAPAYAPTNLRRLVALARAMILDPQVLVLDDPASEFDPESADQVWRHLLDIAAVRQVAVLAAATVPPRLPGITIIELRSGPVPETRRFSADQRRTALLPAIRPGEPLPEPTIAAPRRDQP
jgi:ABC-type multidrug transport system ATPase subunit